MKKLLLVALLALSFNANSALLERLGGLAYYDTGTDLTWVADGRYMAIDTNWSKPSSDWNFAMDWVANLDVAGITGWRLPTTTTDYCSGTGCLGVNELYTVLYNANGGSKPVPVWPDYTIGPFSNVQGVYWTSSEFYSGQVVGATYPFSGNQLTDLKTNQNYAWAVYDGDVSAVPIPAAAWLFGTGLIGLAAVARRKA